MTKKQSSIKKANDTVKGTDSAEKFSQIEVAVKVDDPTSKLKEEQLLKFKLKASESLLVKTLKKIKVL